jgi:hypothetical protein
VGTLVYTLLMLGCADDGSACQRIDFASQRYEASNECQAQIPAALESDAAMRADYPTVEARCVQVRVASAKPHGRDLARR